jgi:hypothetical protein
MAIFCMVFALQSGGATAAQGTAPLNVSVSVAAPCGLAASCDAVAIVRNLTASRDNRIPSAAKPTSMVVAPLLPTVDLPAGYRISQGDVPDSEIVLF